MAENVVSIRGAPVLVPERSPNPEVIAELEHLLEQAKMGEINGLAYAILFHDDCTRGHSVGRIIRSVIGTLAMVSYDLCRGDHENRT